MSDPFAPYAQNSTQRDASLSGLVDFWITSAPHDTTPNVLDKDGNETVGIGIRLSADGQVTYKDRHGIERVDTLTAGTILPTSVSQIMDTGTDDVTVRVAIAP
jgi:hypothetical protein